MARRKSGGEGGGNAVLVIFMVLFALAAIVLGVLYWTGQEKVAAAEKAKRDAGTDIEAANKVKEEAQAKLLLYKVFVGAASEQEKTDLQGASSGGNAETLRREHDALLKSVNDAQGTAADATGKSPMGVQLEQLTKQLNLKPDPKASTPITWSWAPGGTIDKQPSVLLIDRLAQLSADRLRAYRSAAVESGTAAKSGQEYVKAKADYDKFLNDSRTQVGDQIKALEAAMAKVEADKQVAIKEYKDGVEDVRKGIKEKVIEREDALEKLNKTKDVLTNVQRQLAVELARRNAEELEKSGAFAVNKPHGSIVKRSYNEKMVEIDIGSAAGLKPGQTFTVQPASTKTEGLAKRKKQQYVDGKLVVSDELSSKGSIEIVKVLDANLSTARITGEDDDIRDSILKGDLLYNPLFHKNAKDHVVLVGIFDTDGDGVDDIEQVARDLSKRGAIVDGYYDLSTNTWLSPDRGVTKPGPGTNTTYVIRGWEFDSSSTPQLQKEFGNLRSTINETVRSVRSGGAQEVRAVRFLSEIGYPLSPGINDQSITAAAVRFTGTQPPPAPPK